MCSVIEIKNNDEYYIRYHSPDSMVENTVADKNWSVISTLVSVVLGQDHVRPSPGSIDEHV